MSPFPIPRPRSNDGTILPAALVGVLATMLVLQLALTKSNDRDAADAPVRAAVGGARSMAPFPPAIADPVIRAHPIFAPVRSGPAGAGSAAPLADAQVAGSWSVGRQTVLVLRLADGRTRNMHVGQSLNQWTLAAVAADGARFVHGGQRIVVPFGGTTAQAAAVKNPPSEEQQ